MRADLGLRPVQRRDQPVARRWQVAAGCMIVAPAMLAVGNALHPVNHKADEAEFLAGVSAHETQWYLAHLLIFIGLPLFVPAMAGLIHLTFDTAPAWTWAGAILTLFGLFGTEAYVTVEGFIQWTMATTTGVELDQQTRVLQRFNTAAGTAIPIGRATLLFALGMLSLAIASLRCPRVPSGFAGLFLLSRVLALAALIAGVLTGEYQQAVIAAGDALLLLGLGGIGWRLLRPQPPAPAQL